MSAEPEPTATATTPVSPGASGEWEERTLCPDDSCIGVLGPDGRCCLCGLRGDLSRPRHVGTPSSPAILEPGAETEPESEPITAAAASAENHDAAAADDDAFSQRELCSNDSCIGVLSAAGVCPLCGSGRPEH